MEMLHQSVAMPSVVEFSSALESLGWHADFRQLKRGAENVDISVVQGNTTSLMRVGFQNTVHQIAGPPLGYTTFGLPVGPQRPGRLGRRSLESETLTCFSNINGLDVVSLPGFAAYTVALKSSRLAEVAMLFDCHGSHDLEKMQGVQVAPHHCHLARLREMLGTSLTVIGDQATSAKAREFLWREIESDLPVLLLEAWRGSDKLRYMSRSSRTRALKRALEYIHFSAGRAITIEELCRAACCSPSTLTRAFREHFGVPPKQYLMAVQFCGVRRQLIDGADGRTIADIASDFGFWHMSKFAGDYRRLFGELPSQTRVFNYPE